MARKKSVNEIIVQATRINNALATRAGTIRRGMRGLSGRNLSNAASRYVGLRTRAENVNNIAQRYINNINSRTQNNSFDNYANANVKQYSRNTYMGLNQG